MDCKNIKVKLQDLLDGTLGLQQTRQVQSHLKICAACRKEYGQLWRIAQAIISLPYYAPSLNFSAKVLAVLGLKKEMASLPHWAKWSIGALGSLVAGWTVGLVFLLVSRLSLWKVAEAIHLFTNPSKIPIHIKLRLAQSALHLGDLLTAVDTVGRFVSFQTANLPLQLIIATILAGYVVAAISKNAPTGAETKKWRMI